MNTKLNPPLISKTILEKYEELIKTGKLSQAQDQALRASGPFFPPPEVSSPPIIPKENPIEKLVEKLSTKISKQLTKHNFSDDAEMESDVEVVEDTEGYTTVTVTVTVGFPGNPSVFSASDRVKIKEDTMQTQYTNSISALQKLVKSKPSTNPYTNGIIKYSDTTK